MESTGTLLSKTVEKSHEIEAQTNYFNTFSPPELNLKIILKSNLPVRQIIFESFPYTNPHWIRS